MSKRSVKWRIFFLTWHRRIGIAAAIFAVLMAISGIVINHAHDWALDTHPLPASLQRSVYAIHPSQNETGFAVDSHWLSEHADKLYFDQTELTGCKSPLIGSLSLNDGSIALCADGLVFFSPKGELIEKTPSTPNGALKLGLSGNNVYLNTENGNFKLDAESAEWRFSELPPDVNWLSAQRLPDDLQQHFAAQGAVADLTWERFLLDLHSGRLFGAIGVYAVDAAGFALIVLACSGSWLVLSRKHRKPSHPIH
ncbi:MAG TPA: PepSY domain-containing protein [Pseudomonadales bacterium]|nr:PepSY domain-containing protein [Pseudomonadales bacterium]